MAILNRKELEIGDKLHLAKWLTIQAGIYKILKENQDFNEQIGSMLGQGRGIHITNALLVCETLNIPFTMLDWSCDGNKAEEVTFEWDTVEFFGLENLRKE